MTDKEIKERKAAIEFLRTVKIEVNDDGECLIYSSWEIEEAIKALERQTATKPDIWGDGCDNKGNIIYDMYDCPHCGKSYEIDNDKYDYCPNCGQALDWSEQNDR